MLSHIARFEAGYQLRNPVLWISFFIFFLLTFGATVIDQIQIGDTANVKVNSPFVILQTTMIMGIFALFAVAAFLANSVTRDDETGFGPILRATQLTKRDYLFGRFTGAFAAAAIGFAAVPLAIFVGSMMPWLDPEKVGPSVPMHYVYAYLVMGVPMLFVFGSILFAMATATRSMMGAYLGLIAILIGWIVTGNLLNRPEYETISALADPSGAQALFEDTKYWTAAERNTKLPELSGAFLQNRAIWFAVATGFLILSYLIYRPVTKGARPVDVKPSKRSLKAAAKAAAAPAKLFTPSFDDATGWKQLRTRTIFDMRMVLGSPGFFVLMLMGLLNAGGALWFADQVADSEGLPVTRLMVGALQGAYSIIPIIIAAYYAGDLVWRDRERRMHEIIDATPVSDWAFVLPKILAILVVLITIALVGMGAGVLVQTLKGYTNYELSNYLLWWVLPITISSFQLAVLAIFFQALSPNKFVGWGLVILYLISTITLGNLGYQHNLYNYGGNPGVPLSDFGGMAHFWVGRMWFDLYWSAFAAILALIAFGLWRRGAETRLMPRLARFPSRMTGATGTAFGLALATVTGLGGWIYYNTNVLNEYQSSVEAERQQASREKALSKFETLPGPKVVDVTLDVDLRPRERTVRTKGSYVIENRSAEPLDKVMVVWPEVEVEAFDLPGAKKIEDWPEYDVALWRFETPMQPGEKRTMTFTTLYGRPGFTNGTGQIRVVENGTFINNFELAPTLGVTQSMWIRDPGVRRRNGLEPNQRPAKLEDESARATNYLRKDSAWVNADITVTTDDDQIPIAPGYEISESKSNGRITKRFKTDAPIIHFFSVQSARYSVKRSVAQLPAGPVKMEIYHLPQHTLNLDRIEKAMKTSLEVFSERFSPFQFKQMRILEFPGYQTFAQAFANTVPFAETFGWLQANKSPEKVDIVTFVTAHEVAHQWWAHQVIGADKQGMTMLSESFAQYGALLVMEKMLGPDQVRQFLKRELDVYLRARGGEAVEELPLIRVENQAYLHYRKGALIMYFLRNEVGEEPVNRALRRLIAQYGFKDAPFPSSSDFVGYLREEAGPQHANLITDLFEKITLYDAKATKATRKKLADGRWEVTLTANFKKFYASGTGEQTEQDFSEEYEVGIFTKSPATPGFEKKHVQTMERKAAGKGERTFVITLPAGAEKPEFAGVDPYVKRIDRNSDDNIVAIAD